MDYLAALEKGEILTPKQVALRLKVSLTTVRNWLKQGKIHAFRVGGKWQIHKDSLVQLQPQLPPKTQTNTTPEPPRVNPKRGMEIQMAQNELKKKFGI